MNQVEVAVPGPFWRGFTYTLPNTIQKAELFVGQRVVVPFRKGEKVGFIHRLESPSPKGKREMVLKEIKAIVDRSSPFSPTLLKFAEWAMSYYLAPPGEVYRALFPLYAVKKKLSLDVEEKYKPTAIGEKFSLKTLTPLQNEIYQALLDDLKRRAFSAALLHGVTGSGKTEIYLHLMDEVVSSGGQSLFLVPEIGLTPQLLERVKCIFGERVAVSHSGMTDKARYEVFCAVKRGESSIVLGTRSALFLPFRDLRLIVVDEEHDHSYKQEEGFRYHARDLSVVRAQMEKALVLLGSATPSLESLWNAEQGKYRAFFLHERPNAAALPVVRVVDMKRYRDKKGRIPLISEPLRVAMVSELSKKKQVLLFLNRRGYATLIFCNACGEAVRCRHCSVSLTFHQSSGACLCHYCGEKSRLPTLCPACAAPALTRMGSGTERLEAVVSKLFPSARLLRVDRDALHSKRGAGDFFQKMRDREVDIVLGTQVLAKGHDYPHITLVGVIDADLSLNFPDFRAEERAYQSLMQVSGRSGRAESPGEVFIQTVNPEHPIFSHLSPDKAAGFWKREMTERARFGYPPSRSLVQVEVSGVNAELARSVIEGMRKALQVAIEEERAELVISILGPSPAAVAKIRGRHRFQLILRSGDRKRLREFFSRQMSIFERVSPGVRVDLDVDPQSMM